jgi:hypothetical protein
MGKSREVLLVGSMPLQPAAAVFEAVAAHLGSLVPRIPDGEQLGWVNAAFRSFARNPLLEATRKVPLQAKGRIPLDIFRLKTGASVSDLQFGPYGYAENALKSYAQFRRLKEAGKVPAQTRLQVTIPGPGTSAYVVELPAQDLLPIARRALLAEIDEIAAAIPAEELTIQLDIAMEAEHEEYLRRPEVWDAPIHKVFHWSLEQMADSVAWLANRVAPEIELGFHICSIWHHDPHAGQDNRVLVDAANAISSRVTRPIAYFHIPIIPEHTREDFAALRNLKLSPGTRVYLGLINLADGIEGARKRINMAAECLPDFGVGMFCGLGRAAPPGAPIAQDPDVPALKRATEQTLDGVLELHRSIAEL